MQIPLIPESSVPEAWLKWASQPGHYLLQPSDPEYPQALIGLEPTGPMLFVRGRIELLNHASISVVGSRQATALGMQTAREWSQSFASSGLVVISGLARGIDTAAHQGALAANASSTIAVLGCGIDVTYPASNRFLFERIASEGCLVSEFAPGTPGLKQNFPRRNRLIAGLSIATVVVEAARQSGSLITARYAGDFGREVIAIPGSIHSPMSKGCHQLIRDGAMLAESANEVITALGLLPAQFRPRSGHDDPASAGQATSSNDPFLAAIGFEPVHLETLLTQSKASPEAWFEALASLEIDGLVERLADGRLCRTRLAQSANWHL